MLISIGYVVAFPETKKANRRTVQRHAGEPRRCYDFSMTSILEWLRGMTARTASADSGDTDTVRRIVAELDKLEAGQARYLAAFAYVLSRVAGADLQISPVETATMVELVHRLGHLTEAQALLVVEIAKSQQRLFGGTEDFLVTREFREIATEEQRFHLLRCLFAVAVADASISPEEEAQLWQTAGELGFTRAEFTAIRREFSDHRSILQRE
jgi:uncharacterized tellurite resistance protein B-like protein